MNKTKTKFPPLTSGQKVWYRRPEGSGSKTDARWVRPCLVKKCVGENSYEVEVKEGKVVGAPANFLKPYIEDTSKSKPIPLFYHQRTVVEEHGDAQDFIVESILDHKVGRGR